LPTLQERDEKYVNTNKKGQIDDINKKGLTGRAEFPRKYHRREKGSWKASRQNPFEVRNETKQGKSSAHVKEAGVKRGDAS